MARRRMAATNARENLSDILNKVAFGGERVFLERHGKPVAAVVSVEDAELLERLEDKMDLEAARAALAEQGPNISWKQLKAELGL